MSFAALALRARAANDTTRAQINNIPSKSHFIVLLNLTVLQVQLSTAKDVCSVFEHVCVQFVTGQAHKHHLQK